MEGLRPTTFIVISHQLCSPRTGACAGNLSGCNWAGVSAVKQVGWQNCSISHKMFSPEIEGVSCSTVNRHEALRVVAWALSELTEDLLSQPTHPFASLLVVWAFWARCMSASLAWLTPKGSITSALDCKSNTGRFPSRAQRQPEHIL